jgi:hypothetical protein
VNTSRQPAQPSVEIEGDQPSPAEAPHTAVQPSDSPETEIAVVGRLLLPAPGSLSGALAPGGYATLATSAAEAAPAAAASLARRSVAGLRSAADSAAVAAGFSATAEALRQQQRAARSLSLAEYFVKRRGVLNPEDSFRIFCQVCIPRLHRSNQSHRTYSDELLCRLLNLHTARRNASEFITTASNSMHRLLAWNGTLPCCSCEPAVHMRACSRRGVPVTEELTCRAMLAGAESAGQVSRQRHRASARAAVSAARHRGRCGVRGHYARPADGNRPLRGARGARTHRPRAAPRGSASPRQSSFRPHAAPLTGQRRRRCGETAGF